MNPGMRIALTMIAAVVLLAGILTLVALLANRGAAGGRTSGATPSTAESAPKQAAPQPGGATALQPGSMPYAPVQAAPQPMPQPPLPRPVAQQQPQGWNAQNLPGTAWAVGTRYGNFIVHLQPGGQAMASTPMGNVIGTWSAAGNNLTVSAMGQSYTCRIQGWQIIAGDGFPIKKVN